MFADWLGILLDQTKNPIAIFLVAIACVWTFLNYHALIDGKPTDASFKRSVKWLK